MCTAATYKTNDFYFGRTLDYEFSYGEKVVITPRNYAFNFRHTGEVKSHYAIIGMAHIENDYPLYYDAVNEYGLCIAGLNFVGNAVYRDVVENKENTAQFELIPYLLSTCKNVKEARNLISKINITNTPFSDKLPLAELHWIIADKNEAITVESVIDGIKIYDNPVGVLANNPPFDMQMFNLNNYINISPKPVKNNFSSELKLNEYSRGMGALGLPGDLSSMSRFVRVAFTKLNSVSGDSENESISQFFHILGSVCQQKGCCVLADGKCEYTIYTSCINADKGIYYYTTYNNQQISAINLHHTDLDSQTLTVYPLIPTQQINYQN